MKSITFSPKALQQLDEWKITDLKMLAKIVTLIVETANNPFTGIGKPEPLKHQLKGKWSKRINQEHRLVYEVKEDTLEITSCRYHYE